MRATVAGVDYQIGGLSSSPETEGNRFTYKAYVPPTYTS